MKMDDVRSLCDSCYEERMRINGHVTERDRIRIRSKKNNFFFYFS